MRCEVSFCSMKPIWHSYLVLNLGNCTHKTSIEIGLRVRTIYVIISINFLLILLYALIISCFYSYLAQDEYCSFIVSQQQRSLEQGGYGVHRYMNNFQNILFSQVPNNFSIFS